MDAVWKIGVVVAVEMALVYSLGSWLARQPAAVALAAASEAP